MFIAKLILMEGLFEKDERELLNALLEAGYTLKKLDVGDPHYPGYEITKED